MADLIFLWLQEWGDSLQRQLPISIPFTLSLYLCFSLAEFVFVAQKQQSISGRIRNFCYFLFMTVAGASIITFVGLTLNLEPREIEVTSGWYVALRITLYILIADLLYYWYHRFQHTFPLFWTIHELHHSDEELNATTSWRTYWLDYPLQALLCNLPVELLLGTDAVTAGVLPLLLPTWVVLTHSNIRMHLGSLGKVVCGPQVHRIHHSALQKHYDKNFAMFFTFYDVLFGTYFHPARDEYPPTGTKTLASKAPFHETFWKPFKVWAKALHLTGKPK